MPGASEALVALSIYPVQCVASNATESGGVQVAEALERVELRDHLTHFFTSSELGISKPEPGFFERVAHELEIPPDGLISIGNDLRKDIVPAKKAGMATVLVSSNGNPGSQVAADLIVPSLSHLAELLRDRMG
jgi:FMN phosphatase YigB (HAD superfamily)